MFPRPQPSPSSAGVREQGAGHLAVGVLARLDRHEEIHAGKWTPLAACLAPPRERCQAASGQATTESEEAGSGTEAIARRAATR